PPPAAAAPAAPAPPPATAPAEPPPEPAVPQVEDTGPAPIEASAQESLRTTSDAGGPPRPRLSDMRENEVLLGGAGISFQSRNFSPTGLSSLPTYSSALYTSIYATGTVYPFALVARGNKAGLGFFGVFDRAVGLRSQVKASTLLLDTVAQRFEAGA